MQIQIGKNPGHASPLHATRFLKKGKEIREKILAALHKSPHTRTRLCDDDPVIEKRPRRPALLRRLLSCHPTPFSSPPRLSLPRTAGLPPSVSALRRSRAALNHSRGKSTSLRRPRRSAPELVGFFALIPACFLLLAFFPPGDSSSFAADSCRCWCLRLAVLDFFSAFPESMPLGFCSVWLGNSAAFPSLSVEILSSVRRWLLDIKFCSWNEFNHASFMMQIDR